MGLEISVSENGTSNI